MSRIDWWFATTTYGPFPGQRPSTRRRQGGNVAAMSTPTMRRNRPGMRRFRSNGAVKTSSSAWSGSATKMSAMATG